MEKQLIGMVIPRELLKHFEIVKVEKREEEKEHEWESGERIEIFLEEKNTVPFFEEKSGVEIESKGYYPEIQVQDHPIQGNRVFLHIKRRRWREKISQQEIKREWSLVQKGTKYTKNFADFLKEALRR